MSIEKKTGKIYINPWLRMAIHDFKHNGYDTVISGFMVLEGDIAKTLKNLRKVGVKIPESYDRGDTNIVTFHDTPISVIVRAIKISGLVRIELSQKLHFET